MDVEIRPITTDEFEAYLVALEVAFSARVEEGDLDRERSVAIPERFLAAWDGDRIVAGAFNVVKGGRLYGRTWGCDAQVQFLHFEVCYYAAIETCIQQGWTAFEPGHGGGHKYRRGFRPIVTRSSHRLADPRLHEALRRYTLEETAEVEARIEELTSAREA